MVESEADAEEIKLYGNRGLHKMVGAGALKQSHSTFSQPLAARKELMKRPSDSGTNSRQKESLGVGVIWRGSIPCGGIPNPRLLSRSADKEELCQIMVRFDFLSDATVMQGSLARHMTGDPQSGRVRGVKQGFP